MTYYNKDEKIKILKSYLGHLFVPVNNISKNKYKLIKSRLEKTKNPCTKLIIAKEIDYLKLSASILLTSILKYQEYKIVDIDSLMNTWLGYDVGETKDAIKTVNTLVILSFGGSFFKNIQGLIESVVLKRQFDGYNTIILTTQRDKALCSCLNAEDIIELRGSK